MIPCADGKNDLMMMALHPAVFDLALKPIVCRICLGIAGTNAQTTDRDLILQAMLHGAASTRGFDSITDFDIQELYSVFQTEEDTES